VRVLLLTLCAALLAAGPALAGPKSGPTAVVSLGDSYISGEAGRWAGNSTVPAAGNAGTERGSREEVYGTSGACHRSDVAEVMSAQLPVAERVNIACSGGQTRNIFRSASGGQGQNGERAQGDQLLDVAREKDIEMVVLSVGGNDLGFASIVAACLQAYVAKTGPCRPSQEAAIKAKLPKATADVIKSIDEVRAVMAEAGYTPADYRFVMQTYPSVIPRAAENRYPEASALRASNGCPFYDSDSDWARDIAAPMIGDMVKTAAAQRGVEIMELRDLFQGHEFCSTGAAQATALATPDRANSEWGRFLTASTVQQGDLQEAFHPNAYGQQAIGACLTAVWNARTPGRFACAGAATVDIGGLRFERQQTFSVRSLLSAAPRLRVSVKRVRRCSNFTVTSGGGARVSGALIRFAGQKVRTSRTGAARICKTLRRARYSVRVTKRGFRGVTRSVRGRS
jgi:lysophospholipase L1-like esterase